MEKLIEEITEVLQQAVKSDRLEVEMTVREMVERLQLGGLSETTIRNTLLAPRG